MSSFACRFKQLREENGLSQEELANLFNTYKSTICRYETGKRTPPIDFVKEVAIKFNISMDWLIGTSDERIPKLTDMPKFYELAHIDIGFLDIIHKAYKSGLTHDEIKEILEVACKIKKCSNF